MIQAALQLDGGHDHGPLFAPTSKRRMARRAMARKSGGAEVWAKYRRTRPTANDNGIFRDLQVLGRIYKQFTGVRYSVDHIVPLQHPIVCGLHRPTNFEVVPLLDNVRKGNRWWPDMPNEQAALL